MAGRNTFVDQVVGRLLALGPVEARRMFGGFGLFIDGRMFALISRDRLYFKVDQQTEDRFSAAGAQPFTYQREGKRIALSYWEAPAASWEAPAASLGSPEALLPWAQLGVEAARRQAAKAKRKPPAKAKRKPRGRL